MLGLCGCGVVVMLMFSLWLCLLVVCVSCVLGSDFCIRWGGVCRRMGGMSVLLRVWLGVWFSFGLMFEGVIFVWLWVVCM